MSSAIGSPTASAASGSQTPSSGRSSEHIEQDLTYLREKRICEKLEFLVKQLLKHQPEDPVLYICSQLRERCSSSRSAGGVSSGGGGTGGSNSLRSSWNFSPFTPTTTTAAGGGEGGKNEVSLKPESPTTAASTGYAAVSATSGSAAQQQGASQIQKDILMGSTNSATFPMSGSLKTSRVTTPAAARPSASAGGGRGGLERDESVKSDQSCFSISSVDMHEFLAEFRSAKNEFLGPSYSDEISRQDLAEIVDRVNLPLPDVRLIAELFDEMCSAAGAGGGAAAVNAMNKTVPFEAFLSRMAFRIQGRYPVEGVRAVYHRMAAMEGNPADAGCVPGAEGGGDGTVSSDTTPRTAAAAMVGNKSPALSTLLPRTGSSSSSYMTSSAATAAAAVTLTSNSSGGSGSGGVSKQRVMEEGLWHGLGLRLTVAEVNKLLASVGIPQDDGLLLQLTDFLALVNAATGQARDDDV